ncbi:uncharacterized protein LOC110695470 [Chenopodium quinoa]|uniref:uncharacterized protein LOC110695470 n=1 Tax=Chenopodium quinoa TaxID=63459 RepID=UPI000B78AE3A|nr:uncharacterized protein LOC110695470 [Chenopodium quinoa]
MTIKMNLNRGIDATHQEPTHVISSTKVKAPMAALKIDMSRAYDRVNWVFILKILKAYGFPDQWIQWVEQCITTVSYKSLGKESYHTQYKEVWKILWRVNIPPKWSLFLWKLLLNGLAVKANLHHRGIPVQVGCDFYGEEEDFQHLFRECVVAQYVWNNCSLIFNLNLAESTPLRQWIQTYILLFYSEDGIHSERITKFIVTLWCLWRTRNGRVFRGNDGDGEVWHQHMDRAKEDLDIFRGRQGSNSNGTNNVDFQPRDTDNAGLGWDFSLDGNTFQDGGGNFCKAVSALHAEALACLMAIRWATLKGFPHVFLLSDSANLVQSLDNPHSAVVSIWWTIRDIQQLASTLRTCVVWKVGRDQVGMAHDLANTCRISFYSFAT